MLKKSQSRTGTISSIFSKSFLFLALMTLSCQVSFAEPQGEEQAPIAETVKAVVEPVPTAPDTYTKDEVDGKIKKVKDSIPAAPDAYTKDEVDGKIKEVKDSIPSIPPAPDAYTKEYVDNHFYPKDQIDRELVALNGSIAVLKRVLADIRNSIPAEMKWPVKAKQIFSDIRSNIPEDLGTPSE